MGDPTPRNEPPITILLPWYLDPLFAEVFQTMGFRVLWADSRAGLEACLDGEHPDLALEWQHGPRDFPVRDLLAERGLDVPIYLCLNWGGTLPGNPLDLGYAGWLKVPFHAAAMLRLFSAVVREDRRAAMERILGEWA